MLLTQVQEILLEYSFCTVTVQAQKEAAPDMQCKDKFLLQLVKTNDGATIKKITLEVAAKGFLEQLEALERSAEMK
ncbi:vesicle-associated protein 1-3-like [Rosa rugosa]|uniref:vesicle-associated protein 1-3-like n=1 Tax=Rosa rugosa TaxID=74645 RepID=UPI002B408DAC|nr:vesicle-associated protein 1-3-like [Rosa rugosa]